MARRHHYLPTLVSALLAAWTATVPAVQAISPVLPGLWADPNINVFGDTYYLFTTQDGFPDWSGRQFFVWSSPDLVAWARGAAPILTLNGTAGDVPWADGSAWAPTVAERDGRYYFYFSGNNPALGRKTIGVAVADHPAGPYAARATPLVDGTEALAASQTIDPYAFRDPVSGKYYLFWGNGQALAAELGDDMVSIRPDTLVELSGLAAFNEASSVAYREGLYHFNYAINDTRSVYYATGYATATGPTGPYTDRGAVLQLDEAQGILGTGGSTLLRVPGTDDWYMAYHRFRIPGGNGTARETTIDHVYFDNATGLMERVVPTLAGVEGQVVGQVVVGNAKD